MKNLVEEVKGFFSKEELKKTSLCYFSFYGNNKKIAKFLSRELKIKASKLSSFQFPYWLWLIFSFFPLFPVKVFFSPFKKLEENLILCFPKWTFSCPPVNYFLFKCKLNNKKFNKVLLIITFKGWARSHYEKIYQNLFLIISNNVKIIFLNLKEGEGGKHG